MFRPPPKSVARYRGSGTAWSMRCSFTRRCNAERRVGSRELLEAALEDLQEQAKPTDFVEALPVRRLAPLAVMTGVVLAVLSLLLLLFPETLGASGVHLLHFTEGFVAPSPFRLAVTPGNRDIIRGSDVEIRAQAIGTPPSEARLEVRPEDQLLFEDQMGLGDVGEFRTTLQRLRRSLEYRVVAGDQTSEVYRLQVIDRPIIRVLRLGLEFPSYTRLAARQLDDNVGDVLALKGTVVHFRVESSAGTRSGRARCGRPREPASGGFGLTRHWEPAPGPRPQLSHQSG